jgi:hypothetical protein
MYLSVFEMQSLLLSNATNKNHIPTTENCRRFPPETKPSFLLTTLYTTSLAPLAYSAASVSHPIPLSAADRLSA